MPASTSEASSISGSSDSIFSERKTLIGHYSPVSRCASVPRATISRLTSPIRGAEFDRIAAKLRQCWIIAVTCGEGTSSRRQAHFRQMDGLAKNLLHQVEAVDKRPNAQQAAGLEAREMSNAYGNGLAGVQRGQRIPQHRGCRIHAEHNRLALEAADGEIFRDLPDHLEHGRAAAPRAEKWKHVDRAMNRPIDVLVEQVGDILEPAFVDRAMERARKTPEIVLCHLLFPGLDVKTAAVPAMDENRPEVITDVRPGRIAITLNVK